MFDQASVESGCVGEASVPAWMRLHAEMKSATRRRAAWDAEHVRHLREAEAMQLWNHFGDVSLVGYLEREHGIEPRTAIDRLRVAHALGELPLLEAELEVGTLQYSHVKELTRVVTPETEEDWIAAARGKTCKEVQAMVAGRQPGDGPQDPERPDIKTRNWSVPMTPRMEALFRTRRVELEAEMGHRLDEVELWQLILERAGECREGASTPAQISICSHCDRGWQNGAGKAAELEPAEIERARCGAEMLGTVAGEPGRKTATITAKKRARIIARDRHRCAVPGCRSARNLDVHHIEHQEHGGRHADWNLITLCAGHHRAHHRGQLAIEGRAPDRVVFAWVSPGEEPRAHVGTNEGQRAHVGTNEGQRAHVGTNAAAERGANGAAAFNAVVTSQARGASGAARFNTVELTSHTHDPSERATFNTVGLKSQSRGASGAARFNAVVLKSQARDALVLLGWKSAIASAAVSEAIAQVGTEAAIDVVIREALRRCPRPTS